MLRSLCRHKGLEALGQGQGQVSTGMWGRIALVDLFFKNWKLTYNVFISGVQQHDSDIYMYICMYSFSDYFPL